MVAEFSIYPMGQLHYSQILAEVIKEVKNSGLEYQLGPMGTSVEGDATAIFEMIQRCLALVKQESDRVIMHISIDNKAASDSPLSEMVEKVESKINYEIQNLLQRKKA